MGTPFKSDVVAGTILVIPAIQSPNFVNDTSGWQIAQDGSAQFNNLEIRGTFNGTDFIINSSGIFLYSDVPAAGNLVGSWASQTGTDQFGNAFPAGFSSGNVSGAQIQLLPAGGAGGDSAAIQLPSNAGDQAVVPSISGGTLNAGAASQQPYVAIQGPANSNDANQVSFTEQFTAQSDDGTILPGLTLTDSYGNNYLVLLPNSSAAPQLGIGTTFNGSTPVGTTPVAGFLEGSLTTYGTAGGGTIVSTFTTSGSWTCPTGVTHVKAEAWGAGGGGGGGSAPTTSGNGGNGGGGGEYAAEGTLTVTPGHTYTVTVGAGGTGGSAGTPNGSPGGTGGGGSNSTFPGDSVTVTAHAGGGGLGGHNGHVGGAGGTGSANTTHHDGGVGAIALTSGTDTGGGGGGSAGSSAAAGHAGFNSSGRTPGLGGASPGTGSGAGEIGGWGSNSSNGTGGGNGGTAGGGGSGAGGGTDAHTYHGGTGGAGTVKLTYTLPGSTTILASVASGRGAGTDPSGNAIPAGFQGQIVAVKPGSSPSIAETPHIVTYAGTWTATAGIDLTYQLLPDGHVHLSGEILPGTGFATNPNTITTLPSTYWPARDECIPAVFVTSSPTVVVAMIEISVAGVVRVFGAMTAAGNTLRINGEYPLSGQ